MERSSSSCPSTAMATVTQDAFLNAVQQVETKIAELERTASVQQMVNDASLKSIRQRAETLVDQATAKFTQLELQSRSSRLRHRTSCRLQRAGN